MAICFEKQDSKFRIKSEAFSTDWLPDTGPNRKTMLVLLRILRDASGNALFTFQELAPLVGSDNRQAASNHVESFRDCGSDFLPFLNRKKKVDDAVVSAVLEEVRKNPLVKTKDLAERVNGALSRNDLSSANMESALEQAPYGAVRKSLLRMLETGQAHYKERSLLEEMAQIMPDNEKLRAFETGGKAGGGMELVDPTAVRNLVTPGVPLSSIHPGLKLIVALMVLFHYGIPLSVLGRWSGVNKTTVLRRILGLSLALWPKIYDLILKNCKPFAVYIDEKWLKIKGKWHYWFVVLDAKTKIPILSSLEPSRSNATCKWIGQKLTALRMIPKIIITDGLQGYNHLLERVTHIHCIFHHQLGVTRWLKKHFSDKDEIALRKRLMKGVFQAKDKRTVRLRFLKLKKKAAALGIEDWIKETERNFENLLAAVGSEKIPNTTNAVERFFRGFNRFYKIRCGFFSVLSAQRMLIFYQLMYLLIPQTGSGRAPIEHVFPEYKNTPLYQLVNNPLKALMGEDFVKKRPKFADLAGEALKTA